MLLTLGSIGFVLGAVVAERAGRRLGVGPALVVSALLTGVGTVFLPFATPQNRAVLLVLYGLVGSAGGVVLSVNARSLFQIVTPDAIIGRAFATHRFVVWGAIPLGSFLGGVLGSHLGLRPTLAIAAAGELLGFLPPLLSPLRRLRAIPGEAA